MRRKEAIKFLDKATDKLDRVYTVKSNKVKGTSLDDDMVMSHIVNAYEAGLIDAMLVLREVPYDSDPETFALSSLGSIIKILVEHERKCAND